VRAALRDRLCNVIVADGVERALAANLAGQPFKSVFEVCFLGVLPDLMPPAFGRRCENQRRPILALGSVNKFDGFPTLCLLECFRFTLGPAFWDVRDARKSITAEFKVESPVGSRCGRGGRRSDVIISGARLKCCAFCWNQNGRSGSLFIGMSALGLVSRVTPVQTAKRNCTRDEGGPFEFGNQVLISSHRKLLWSKAMVVSVAEKSDMIPSGKVREAGASGPSVEVSKADRRCQNRGVTLWDNSGDA